MDRRNDPSQNYALSVAKLLCESPSFQAGGWEVYIQIPFWCMEFSSPNQLHAPYTGKSENEGILDLLVCQEGKTVLGVSFNAYDGYEIILPGLPTLELPPAGYPSATLHPELFPQILDDMYFSAGAVVDALQIHAEEPRTRPFHPWDGGTYLADPAAAEDRLQRLHLIQDGMPTAFGAACGLFRQVLPKAVRWVFHPASRSMVLSMLLGLGRTTRVETIPLAVRKARLAVGLPTDNNARADLARAYGDLLQMNIDQLCSRHKEANPKDLKASAADARQVLHLPASTAEPTLWDLLNLLHGLRLHYAAGGDPVHTVFDNLILPLLRCFLPLNVHASGITSSAMPPEPKIEPPPPAEEDGPVSLEQRLRRFHQESSLIRQFSEMPLLSYCSALCAYTGTLYPLWLGKTRLWPKPIRRDVSVGKAAAAAQAMILQEFQEEILLEEEEQEEQQEHKPASPPADDVSLPPGRQMAYDLLAESLFPFPDLLA